MGVVMITVSVDRELCGNQLQYFFSIFRFSGARGGGGRVASREELVHEQDRSLESGWWKATGKETMYWGFCLPIDCDGGIGGG